MNMQTSFFYGCISLPDLKKSIAADEIKEMQLELSGIDDHLPGSIRISCTWADPPGRC